MAYSKLYERINFVNESEGKTTPLGAVNMNKLDYAVDALDDRTVELDKNKLEKSSIDSLVADISYEKDSGELTVSRVNSLPKKIDLGTSEILEKVNDVSKEVEDLNKKTDEIIENIGIKNTASGENIHLTDSADSKVIEFGLHGNAEQKQYSGKQLLTFSLSENEVSGVKRTPNPDGSIKIIGTATENSAMYLITDSAKYYLEAGSYYLSSCGTCSGKCYMGLGAKNSSGTVIATAMEGGTPTEFTLSERAYISLYSMVPSGSTVDTTIYPMICPVSADPNTFEPFVGNAPSPSPDYPQDIEVAGESYNELEITIDSQTINGGTVTVNEDKSITVNGTFTAETTLILNRVALKANTGYILSGCPSGGSITTYRLLFQESSLGYAQDTGNGANVTPTENIDSARITLQIFSGTVNNLTFYPMLRKASVKNNRYMPYGVGSIEVKSVGKNQLDVSKITSGYPDATSGASIDDIVASTRYAHSEPIKISEPVTIQWKANSGLDYIRYFLYKDGIYQSQKNLVHTSDGTHTIPKSDSYDTMILVVGTTSAIGTWDNSYLVDCQIEYGTTATPYEPYTETTSTISTPDGIAGINGVYDEVVKYADGSGKRIQRIINIVKDNMLIVRHSATNENYFVAYVANTGKPSQSSVISTHFTQSALASSLGTSSCMYVVLNNDAIHISIPTSIANDVATLKQWLLDNNVKIYYPLATPIITDLTAEEIAEIEKLHTFYPVTNISNDADCNMAFKYLCDSKNYIDNKFALIEAAMVNNI